VHRLDAVLRGDAQPRLGEVDADVAVPVDVRGEQTTAAADVEQDGVVAGRGRDQPPAGLGQPVQRREGAGGAPPLADEVVVLP
jgi:hypothetical protein